MSALKASLFYVLMFLRPFLKFALKIISVLFLISAVVAFASGGSGMGLFMLFWMFLCFLVGWFYDTILLKLNPENNVLVLER